MPVVALLAALLAAGGAQTPGRVAVLQLQGARLSADESVRLTDLLHLKAAAAARDSGLKVIGSSELAAALEGAGIDAAHCEDECVPEAGKAAAADFVLSGRATKLSDKISLLLMLHSADGALVSSTQVRPDTADDLPDALAGACRELLAAAGKSAGKKKSAAVVADRPAQPPAPVKLAEAAPVKAAVPQTAAPVKAAPVSLHAPAAAVEAAADSSPSRTPYVVVGAVALAAGLAMDVFPESAHDHKLTGADFVPLALYAVGVGVIAWGLTR